MRRASRETGLRQLLGSAQVIVELLAGSKARDVVGIPVNSWSIIRRVLTMRERRQRRANRLENGRAPDRGPVARPEWEHAVPERARKSSWKLLRGRNIDRAEAALNKAVLVECDLSLGFLSATPPGTDTPKGCSAGRVRLHSRFRHGGNTTRAISTSTVRRTIRRWIRPSTPSPSGSV